MKKIVLIAFLGLGYGIINAQSSGNPVINSCSTPVCNPYQFPNYSQNNASYINNSMQNNKPVDVHAGPYTGNADYVDPSRNYATPRIYDNPVNTNSYNPVPIPVPPANNAIPNQNASPAK
jgi:hypothetical protein